MDRATLHAFLMSMPEAEEYLHGDHPAFRIRGRPRFATMLDDEGVNLFPGEPGIRHFVEHHPEHCTERWWGKKLAAVRLAYPGRQTTSSASWWWSRGRLERRSGC